MPTNTSTKGFSVTGLVIILAVIAILGLGGWYVWRINNQTSTSGNINTSETQNGTKQSPLPSPDPSEGGKYLVIKEWGVRIPLPAALQGDAHYVYFTNPSIENPALIIESIDLRSKKLDQITKECNGIKFDLQTISRSKDKLSGSEYEYVRTELNYRNLADYWYHIVDQVGIPT